MKGQNGAVFSCIFFKAFSNIIQGPNSLKSAKNLDFYLFSCAAVMVKNLKCLPTSRFRKYIYIIFFSFLTIFQPITSSPSSYKEAGQEYRTLFNSLLYYNHQL